MLNYDISQLLTNEGIVLRKYNHSGFILRKLSESKGKGVFNLISLVKNPLISSDKYEAPMFKIGIATKESLSSSSPIDIYTRLVIDYDNYTKDNKLLKKFITKFNKYSFILYTTWSSTNKCPRFRVIIEIKNILFSSYLRDANYRQYLVKEFSIDDEKPDDSCFLPTQCQLTPVTDRKYYYKYVINEGKRYKLKEYKDVVEQLKESIDNQINSFALQDINKIVDETYFANVRIISNSRVEKVRKKVDEKLLKIKNNNFVSSKEYKEAKIRLEKILEMEKLGVKVKKFGYKNKNEFLTHVLTIAVHLRNLEYFFNKWKKEYGFDIKDNPKWFKKYQEFFPKLLNFMEVREEELV